jgi:cytochrome oxidase Cu insertion factor (SCO1/SenC/PrrC family)
MKKTLSFFLLLIPLMLGAQDFNVTVSIKGAENRPVRFAQFKDLDFQVVDTTRADENGRVNFLLAPNTPKGLFRIYTGKDEYFDVIFGREDIEMEIDYNDAENGMNVIQSFENKAWYAYLDMEFDVMNRMEMLTPLVSHYPEGALKDSAIAEYNRMQQELLRKVREICDEAPQSLACHMAAVRKPPLMPAAIPSTQRLAWLQENYFAGLDMNDTMLLNTTVYADKVIDYIGTYGDRNLTQSELEDRFIVAIDKLMTYVQPELGVYSYIVQYLVNGFERYKFEKVLNHIAENYITEFSCGDEDQKKAVEKRLESYRRMAVGKQIPEFSVPDADGNLITLASLQAPHHLLLFWSSTCPHCTQMLPELEKMYQGKLSQQMDILAVSLDKDKAAWQEVLKTGNYPWVHVSELQGWNAKIANDFHIYATPTMILTDAQGKIIAKPITLPELRTELRNREIMD